MAYKFTNGASATLAGSITTTTTVITLTAGMGALFPTLAAGDYFYATLIDSSNNVEIVLVTARVTDTLTVTRAQDGTSARAFLGGDKFELRLTAAGIAGIQDNVIQSMLPQSNTWTGLTNTFKNIVGLGAITSGGSSAIIYVQDRVTNTNTYGLYSTGDVLRLFSGVSGNTGDRWYIDANGNLGLATTLSPWGSATPAIQIGNASFSGNSASSIMTVNAYHDGTTYKRSNTTAASQYYQTAGVHYWRSAAAGTTGANITWTSTATLDASGNFLAYGSVSGTSDERLKTNWRSLPFGMSEALANVKCGIYDRIDTGITQCGVSAQSLQKVLPEAVIEGEDGMLSVAYGNAAMVAVVELSKEIVKLRQEIAELRGN